MILFHETLYQSARNGERFVDILSRSGILVGIKVDKGLKPLPRHESETYTEGAQTSAPRARRDGDKRLTKTGARSSSRQASTASRRAARSTTRRAHGSQNGGRPSRFAARSHFEEECRENCWSGRLNSVSAQIDVAAGLPSDAAVDVNAAGLADYASLAQQAGLVPIVEPEILIDGDHDIDASAAAAEHVIAAVYEQLRARQVLLEGSLLKPMMIMPGASCKTKASAERVAQLTISTMRRCVPPAVPGIMFLSGGMSEEQATVNLNTLNRLADAGDPAHRCPWSLSFSYGRALQSSVLKIWR